MTIIGQAFVQLQPFLGDFSGVAATEMGTVGGIAGGSFKKSFAKGVGDLGLGLLAAGVAMFHFSEQSQSALALLKNAITTTGAKYDTYAGQIGAADRAGAHFGYSNAKINNALAILVRGFGSTKEGLADIGHVADLAAARQMDLNSAATMYVRTVAAGQFRALAALGIDTKEMTKAQSAQASAQKEVTKSAAEVIKAHTKLEQLEVRLKTAVAGATSTPDAIAAKNAEDLQAAQLRLAAAQQKLNEAVTPKEQQTAQNEYALAQLHMTEVQTEATERATAANAKYVGSNGLTIAQNQQLANAKNALILATQKHTDSIKAEANANALLMKTTGGRTVQQMIDWKTKGAADAIANTWQGILNRVRAKFEDWAAEFGQQWALPLMATGGALYLFSKALPVLGKMGGWAKSILGMTTTTTQTTAGVQLQTAGVTLNEAAEALMAAAEKLSMAGGFGRSAAEGPVNPFTGKAVEEAAPAALPAAETGLPALEGGFLPVGVGAMSAVAAGAMALALGGVVGTLINQLPKLWGGKSISTDLGNWIMHGSLVKIAGEVKLNAAVGKGLNVHDESALQAIKSNERAIALLKAADASHWVRGGRGMVLEGPNLSSQQVSANQKLIAAIQADDKRLSVAQQLGLSRLSLTQLKQIGKDLGVTSPVWAGQASREGSIVTAIEKQTTIQQQFNEHLRTLLNPQRSAAALGKAPTVIVSGPNSAAVVKAVDKALGIAS
jgi:hypothetical protein